MKNAISWLSLIGLLALGTALLGWWAVPAIAAVYGFISPERRHGLSTALAGALAWGLLLAVTASQGPVLELAARVAAVLTLPTAALFVVTLVFPALLAGSAAELTAAVRKAALERTDQPVATLH
jgi:hypothetical protein